MDDPVGNCVNERCIHPNLNSMDDLSEMSPSDDDDDSYTTYNDEDFANDDECDDNTVDEVFKRVDIEWITTAITRILSDDVEDYDDDDHADADDERTATPKHGICLEWSRLGLLSEAISQFIEEEEECTDDVRCVDSEKVILNGLPLLGDASSSSETSTSR